MPKNPVRSERAVLPSAKFRVLSKELEKIEQPVFKSIKEKLASYSRNHPNSPIFSETTLFGPIGYGRLEPAVTRTIAWLIDESQPHEFGPEVADLIFKLVGDKRSVKSVTLSIPERVTQKNKFIDVWAEGKWTDDSEWTLVIEAKIDASESSKQLKYYEDELNEKKVKNWTGIFLTPNGRPPQSDKSKKWNPVSFEKLAETLTAYYCSLNSASDKEKVKAGAEFLRLFTAGLLRDVLRRPIPVSEMSSNLLEISDLISTDITGGDQ